MPVLLLVGAGHGHLHVVQGAARLADAGYRVQLLAPRFFDYSGVASATAAGAVPGDAGRIDVRALASACGVEHHEGTLDSLDADGRVAVTADGTRLSYDVLSVNVGSVVAPADMVVHPSVLAVKPLRGLSDLDARLRATDAPGATVTVVGGGSSGLELAAHLAVRRDVARVQLVESGAMVGADLPAGARRRIVRLLAERAVVVHTGCAVAEIGERSVLRADGATIPHDVALLAVGLRAPGLIARWGIGDEHGVPVRATLQHVDRDEIHAVGDCANFLPTPLPRIGVHGVRQGSVLLSSLLARAEGTPLPTYRPQRRALSILDLGDRTGLAVWGRLWWFGAGPWRLKRLIDRRWLERYRT